MNKYLILKIFRIQTFKLTLIALFTSVIISRGHSPILFFIRSLETVKTTPASTIEALFKPDLEPLGIRTWTGYGLEEGSKEVIIRTIVFSLQRLPTSFCIINAGRDFDFSGLSVNGNFKITISPRLISTLFFLPYFLNHRFGLFDNLSVFG